MSELVGAKTPLWRPLVEGPRRERALDALDALAAALLEDEAQVQSAGLASGHAGLALLFAELAEVRPGEGHEEHALRFLGKATDALSLVHRDASLYDGYAGIAFVYGQLAPRLYEDVDLDALTEIDEALLERLQTPEPSMSHDLCVGLSGLMVYALAPSRDTGDQIAAAIVQELDRRPERGAIGTTWATTPAMLSGAPASADARSFYNLGVAHGVPGVLAALAAALHAGVERERAQALLDTGVRWLLSQRRPDSVSAYGYLAGDVDSREAPTRIGWCYGDAAIAATLEWIGRITATPRYREAAIELGLRAAARTDDTSGVRDAGLCHGSAGVMQIFNRLWQATNEARFADAARHWFDQTLAFAAAPAGVRGWKPFRLDDSGMFTSWLEAATGVGLALTAAIDTREPAWDRALLLSPPCEAT